MPRELLTVHVGQCGNQLGRRFWQYCEQENDPSIPFSTAFFREDRGKLKARAVLVDMEQGPVMESLRGPSRDLFDHRQTITDVSGAGNNFAYGHYIYGNQYEESVMELVRREAEMCDSLQAFLLTHSLGGGTGSGLGTRVLRALEDNFPSTYRFVSSVFPADDDVVITSPYNSVFALEQLTEHADCVFPLDNTALARLAPQDSEEQKREEKTRGFDSMNDVAAQMLSGLTCSARFPGEMNVDINEICTNMVPFPRLHYLATSVIISQPEKGRGRRGVSGPVSTATATTAMNPEALVGRAFRDLLSKERQLCDINLKSGPAASLAIIGRGKLSISDFTSNASRIHGTVPMVPWNCDGLKIGMCSVPPLNSSFGLLGVCNTAAFTSVLDKMESRLQRLYSRKAMLHHYLQHMEQDQVQSAIDSLCSLRHDYANIHAGMPHNAQLCFPVY